MGQRIPFLESAAKWMPEICGFGSMTNGHRGGVVVREKVSTLLASHFKSRSVTSFACWACAPCARITRIKHDASLLWLKKSCALAALGFAGYEPKAFALWVTPLRVLSWSSDAGST